MNKKVKKIFQSNEPYIFLIIILLGIVVQIRSGQFFTANNIVDLLSAMIVPGLFAIAEFMALIAGGIDVSFPALASLSAYATTKFLLDKNYEGNVLLAFVIAIAIGAVLGAFNGYFIGYLNLNAMIVTLGSASIFQGIMQGTVCAVMHFVLHYTIFGRGIYAIGGNPQSAHTAGFNVKRTKFIMYIIIGMIASASGICRVCMMQQMHPTNMLGMEMNIIAGVVLGGVALTGGAGTLTGCILGTFLIILVQNSMILLGIPTTWSDVFVGLVIVIGVSLTAWQSTRTSKSKKKAVKEGA